MNLETVTPNGSDKPTAEVPDDLRHRKPVSTLESIVHQLQERSKQLAEQLNAFKQIEDEYKTVTRALRALLGKETRGRKPNPPDPKEGTRTWADKASFRNQVLKAIANGHNTVHRIANVLTEKSAAQIRSVCTALAQLKLVKATGQTVSEGKNVNIYALTPAGLARIAGNPQAHPKASQPPTVPPTIRSTDVLQALVSGHPKGMRCKEVVAALGHEGNKHVTERVGVTLAFTRTKKWAISKEGSYVITPAGRAYLAGKIAKGAS